jgi:hypothetical protein
MARGGPLTKPITLAVVTGAAMIMLGSGVAQAGSGVIGKTFAQASEALKKEGYQVRVSTVVGDQLPQSDCVVTGQSAWTPPPSFIVSQFNKPPSKAVSLSLDCYGEPASASQPGYSAVSPEAKDFKKVQETVEWQKTPEGQKWCADAKTQNPDWDWSLPKLAGCKGA